MRASATSLLLASTALAASCGRGDPAHPTAAPESPPLAASAAAAPASPAPSAAPGPFDARLLEVARDYGRWTKVKPILEWAPTDCVPPTPTSALHASASKDDATHGQKLYYLFARDPAAYPPGKAPAPAGQVIVKESWAPALIPADEAGVQGDVAMRDGRRYRAGARAGLFVMMKLAPDTEGTDRGWVYGVVSPDGSRVEAAGRLDNCIACHTQAPGDRLFGPPL